mgnify:CR=1 FL=1
MPITPTLSNIDAVLAFLLPLLVGVAVGLTGQHRTTAAQKKGVMLDTGFACRGSQ